MSTHFLRQRTSFNILKPERVCRFYPAGSDEVVPPPTKFYILKQYDRNPFYMTALHLARPGYKKLHNPYLDYLNRRAYHWKPQYKGQQFDYVGPVMLAGMVIIPFAWCCFMIYEAVSFYIESKKTYV